MSETVKTDSAFYVRFNKGYELMEKHPDHVPVMFSSKDDIGLEKNTIMCGRSAPLSNVILQFRKYLSLDNNKSTAGFVFSIPHKEEEVIPKLSERMGDLHTKYAGQDMWLTLKIRKEDVFGSLF